MTSRDGSRATVRTGIDMKEKEAERAAERSVDTEGLLEGEAPSSELVEDAEHWISVYRELIAYKHSLLGTSADEIADFEHSEARGEAQAVDHVILRTELDRFRGRLAFWRERLEELRSRHGS